MSKTRKILAVAVVWLGVAIVVALALVGHPPTAQATYGQSCENPTIVVAGSWWNWSPNHDQGPFDGPPAFPDDPRGTWQGPHDNGGPTGTGTFQIGNGHGDWFHRDADTEEPNPDYPCDPPATTVLPCAETSDDCPEEPCTETVDDGCEPNPCDQGGTFTCPPDTTLPPPTTVPDPCGGDPTKCNPPTTVPVDLCEDGTLPPCVDPDIVIVPPPPPAGPVAAIPASTG